MDPAKAKSVADNERPCEVRHGVDGLPSAIVVGGFCSAGGHRSAIANGRRMALSWRMPACIPVDDVAGGIHDHPFFADRKRRLADRLLDDDFDLRTLI